MSTSSRTEIVLVASPDGPITAHDPFSFGPPLARFSTATAAATIPRNGLALVGPRSVQLIAASHISPSTAACSVRLYSWWSPAPALSLPVPEPVAPVAATPDGPPHHLFCGGLSGRIHVLSLPSGDLCRPFTAHTHSVSCLAVNDDGSLLISASDDGTIAVFPIIHLLDEDPAVEVTSLYTISAHDAPITCITSGPGGCNAAIVSSSLDGTCKMWRLADGVRMRTLTFPCGLWCVTTDPIDSQLYTGGSDGKVYVVPLIKERVKEPTKRVIWESPHSSGGEVMAMVMANDNENIVTAYDDGAVKIWEVKSGLMISTFCVQGGSVSDLIVVRGSGVHGVGGSGVPVVSGFAERELQRKGSEVWELEKRLSEVREGRNRGLDLAEDAMDVYRRSPIRDSF
ncbi:Protein ROOT INITIATION DEFECTIVE 3 [Ananas comosus]|uniref:Protein ROOT INITIATION DEFECTIVE 3 n=1 Tax=Ananas comosus TaxID=4615 RepID=A0A199UEC6_ANACO|nr:Protein ROOT INITIATION DEFECTIVE 3 [Ananas comosus]